MCGGWTDAVCINMHPYLGEERLWLWQYKGFMFTQCPSVQLFVLYKFILNIFGDFEDIL
jgi:hypothetical protein